LRIVAELRKETEPGSKLRNALTDRFRSALFISVDGIELVPSGTLQASEHKDKAVVDLRKSVE
jgi:hypothetical protein